MDEQALSVSRKPRGRPRVDAILVGVRIPPDVISDLDVLVEEKELGLNRPEVIRYILRQWIADNMGKR